MSDCSINKLQYKTNKNLLKSTILLSLGTLLKEESKEEMKEEGLSQHILFKNDKLSKLFELNIRL